MLLPCKDGDGPFEVNDNKEKEIVQACEAHFDILFPCYGDKQHGRRVPKETLFSLYL